MSVTLTVTKGSLLGKKYVYDEKTRLFIGRQGDCGIIMPESTVSRYHCVLEITPPEVKLQDFGSLNGTFINDEKIGQREADNAVEEKDIVHTEYRLSDGDTLGLGRGCELTLRITESTQDEQHSKTERTQKKCIDCGKDFYPGSDDNALCPECFDRYAKQMDNELRGLIGSVKTEKQEHREIKASPIAGFEMVSRLGTGGMGEVWRVRELSSGKLYALKMISPQVKTSDTMKEQFLREAEIAVSLNHKNVVATHKTGSADGCFYILMDLYEGGSVDSFMGRMGGKLSLVTSTYIILQVLSGLDYVHKLSVVHRDIKPGNIFLSDNSGTPTAQIADFGMTKAFDTAGLSRITKTGTYRGTSMFMSRAQATNFKYAKPEVDIWAAAATYYNMLTGAFVKNFSHGRNPWYVITTQNPVPILERDDSIPPELAAVIDRALIEQPTMAYHSALELRSDIVAALPADVKEAVKEVL